MGSGWCHQPGWYVTLPAPLQAAVNRVWRVRRALHRRQRGRQRPDAPVVGVVGPPWLHQMVKAAFRMGHVPGGAPVDVVVCGPGAGASAGACGGAGVGVVATWRNDVQGLAAVDPAPFIEPSMMNPIVAEHGLVGLPADMAVLATDARRLPSPPRGAHGWTAWLEATRAAHPAYRRAHARVTADVVADALMAGGDDGGRVRGAGRRHITMVCVTRRLHLLGDVVANFDRQSYPHVDLVVVTNAPGVDTAAVEAVVGGRSDIRWVAGDPDATLGACLNEALDRTDATLVAKVDDDDHYGADYLADLEVAWRFSGAAVTGKHSHYAWFADRGQGFLRFVGREFEFTDWLAGGTLLVDRDQTGALRFADVSLGEDAALLAACRRRGLDLFAADRFNYAQIRHGDNTWTVDDDRYLRRSLAQAGDDPGGLCEV